HFGRSGGSSIVYRLHRRTQERQIAVANHFRGIRIGIRHGRVGNPYRQYRKRRSDPDHRRSNRYRRHRYCHHAVGARCRRRSRGRFIHCRPTRLRRKQAIGGDGRARALPDGVWRRL
ncbi:uncharacterized protein METZ01_LOCUS195983, partial [marine metagenome]